MFEDLTVIAALATVALAMVSTEIWRLSSERLISAVFGRDDRLLVAIAAHEESARAFGATTAAPATSR